MPRAQVLAITRYDGRGAIQLQDSVKAQHILPFFTNFVLLASRLEGLLVGTEPDASGAEVLHGSQTEAVIPCPHILLWCGSCSSLIQ
jgi:hypothetical protein